MTEPAYMTIKDAAEYLGLTEPVVRSAIAGGHLKATRLTPRGRWLIRLSDLEEHLAGNETRPRVEAPKRRRRRRIKHVEWL